MSYDRAGANRFLEESRAEQARLSDELEELRARTSAAEAAQQRTAARIRATFVELTDAARAELVAIDAEHAEAVAALRSEADAAATRVADGHPSEGP